MIHFWRRLNEGDRLSRVCLMVLGAVVFLWMPLPLAIRVAVSALLLTMAFGMIFQQRWLIWLLAIAGLGWSAFSICQVIVGGWSILWLCMTALGLLTTRFAWRLEEPMSESDVKLRFVGYDLLAVACIATHLNPNHWVRDAFAAAFVVLAFTTWYRPDWARWLGLIVWGALGILCLTFLRLPPFQPLWILAGLSSLHTARMYFTGGLHEIDDDDMYWDDDDDETYCEVE